MRSDKFMKAIEDVTSFIGSNNDGDHWGTITWHEADVSMKRKTKRNSTRSNRIVKSREIQ